MLEEPQAHRCSDNTHRAPHTPAGGRAGSCLLLSSDASLASNTQRWKEVSRSLKWHSVYYCIFQANSTISTGFLLSFSPTAILYTLTLKAMAGAKLCLLSSVVILGVCFSSCVDGGHCSAEGRDPDTKTNHTEIPPPWLTYWFVSDPEVWLAFLTVCTVVSGFGIHWNRPERQTG